MLAPIGGSKNPGAWGGQPPTVPGSSTRFSGTPLRSQPRMFHKGGKVKASGSAQVKKGEVVLTSADIKTITEILTGKSKKK